MGDEGEGGLLGDLEGRVAVDVEPGAAGEEEDVVGQVEGGGDGDQGEEEEDEGPCGFCLGVPFSLALGDGDEGGRTRTDR